MGLGSWLFGEPVSLPTLQVLALLCPCGELLRTSGFSGSEALGGKMVTCPNCRTRYFIKQNPVEIKETR